MHNHLRQYCLKLEKKWVTHNAYFRLATTITDMNVIDTYRLSRFHSLLPSHEFKIIDIDRGLPLQEDIDGDGDFTIKKFAGILSRQLFIMAESLSDILPGKDWDDCKRTAALTNTSKSSKGKTKSNQNKKSKNLCECWMRWKTKRMMMRMK